MKAYSFDVHFVLQKAISNWCLVHPLRSESYLFPPIHLVHYEMLYEVITLSMTKKQRCPVPHSDFVYPHPNIVHECPFHFSVCFRSETRHTGSGSVWHICLRTSPKSSAELLLKPFFTQYIAHTTCALSTIPSKNGK